MTEPGRSATRSWVPALAIATVLIAFILGTLSHPEINGDEALNGIMAMRAWKDLLSFHTIPLNPTMSYIGPIDIWTWAPILALATHLGGSTMLWAMRAAPFIVYLLGVAICFRELRLRSNQLALTFCCIALSSPFALISSRWAWSPSFLPGLLLILWTESLRIRRTADVRWIRLGVIAGCLMLLHPTSLFGIFAALLPAVPVVLRGLRRDWLKCLLAVLIFLVLTYPITRNLPYPTDGDLGSNFRWIQEFRGVLHIMLGFRSLEYIYHHDLTPVPILATIFGFQILVWSTWFKRSFIVQWRSRAFQLELLGLVGASLGVFVLSIIDHRYLSVFSSERYLLCVLPGWLLLWSEALVVLFRTERHLASALTLLVLISAARITVPMMQFLNKPDPFEITSQWLQSTCPSDHCVVYAENYWNYWPIQFYARGHLALNGIDPKWSNRLDADHAVNGRKRVACWFRSSEAPRPRHFETTRLFPDGATNVGQECFGGIFGPVKETP